MTATLPQSLPNIPRTLLGIPPELRLRVYDYVLEGVTIEIERGPVRLYERFPDGTREATFEEPEGEEDGEEGNDSDNTPIVFCGRETYEMSELPKVPQDIVNLKLVCRTINNEIGNDEWHSKVWYRFPSTVAFIDILSQWPEAKVRSLRMVHVVDTPLPLYPYGDYSCYHTHDFADALPIFPGLQLDVLVVENIWLLPSGIEVDGWCLGATYHAIRALAASAGWKELQYRTGILGLTPRLQRSVEDLVQKRRDDSNEPDLELTWGRIRPQLSGLVTHNVDGTQSKNDPEMDVKEVREWCESHKEEPPEDQFPEDVTELDCHLKLRRGANANYTHDGKGKSAIVESLLNNMRWVDLRENNQHLVDDGIDESIGHL